MHGLQSVGERTTENALQVSALRKDESLVLPDERTSNQIYHIAINQERRQCDVINMGGFIYNVEMLNTLNTLSRIYVSTTFRSVLFL